MLPRPTVSAIPRPRHSLVGTCLAAVAALGLSSLVACSRGAPGTGGEGQTTSPIGTGSQGDQTGETGGATGAAPNGEGLRLVVVLVIDQWPSWSFRRDEKLLDGGFGRLLREGTVYPAIEIPYAVTYTAPGHAALGTGAPPSESHILANAWYEPKMGIKLSAVYDPKSPVFDMASGAPGEPTRAGFGASGARLAVDGVADALRAATGDRARSVSISIKKRAAALATGRRPGLAIWYEPTQAAMTTSRFYAEQPPAWLRELARKHPVAPRLDDVWQRLSGIDHAAITGIADAIEGEIEEYGMGNTFPYDLSKSSNPAKSLRVTPIADDLILETAMAAIAGQELGTDEVTDLLCLSFSAHDSASHNWGQESWERLDLLLRLDEKLGRFLAHLDAEIGKGRYAVVLSSDHGATPLVEHTRRKNLPAARIAFKDVAAAADRAIDGVLGEGTWVADAASSNLYMSAAFKQRSQADQDRALEAAVTAVAGMPGIAYATRVDAVAGSCGQRTGLEALVCRSVVLGSSGEVFYTPVENSLLTRYQTGTGHGSPDPSNRFVPLIISAPGWSARRVEDQAVSMLQIAPTVAALLGVPPPAGAKAPALRP